MKIETKYNIGQKVFYLAGAEIRKIKIEVIETKIRGKNNIDILYGQRYFKHDDRCWYCPENIVFSSKKEAKNYLLEKVNDI